MKFHLIVLLFLAVSTVAGFKGPVVPPKKPTNPDGRSFTTTIDNKPKSWTGSGMCFKVSIKSDGHDKFSANLYTDGQLVDQCDQVKSCDLKSNHWTAGHKYKYEIWSSSHIVVNINDYNDVCGAIIAYTLGSCGVAFLLILVFVAIVLICCWRCKRQKNKNHELEML